MLALDQNLLGCAQAFRQAPRLLTRQRPQAAIVFAQAVQSSFDVGNGHGFVSHQSLDLSADRLGAHQPLLSFLLFLAARSLATIEYHITSAAEFAPKAVIGSCRC